ncbi:MAG: HD domain-containing protein [Planctomycetota bacterium]|nr:HD domain-containing protein [Planctomycetota bacterium]MDP6763794.1 HD domain-containing protein [Planctomycetota bacterium]MDP6989006.1 HD domain-containing protein [Planctomycetota bacterium]
MSQTDRLSSLDQLFDLFAERGERRYYGEEISLLAHSLQAAQMGGRAGAPPALVAAALLHDVGHMLWEDGEDFTERGIDDGHEEIGAVWLAGLFGEAVCEPIRRHVDAKRYLCATEIGYGERLSATSKQSLALQGGPMSPAEASAFQALPGADGALALRRWDEAAKVCGAPTRELLEHRTLLEALVHPA